MLEAVADIRALLDGRTFESMYRDRAVKAAFERYLEILSEASRHVPEGWRMSYGPDLDWRSIGDLGNALRHAYHKVDHLILWEVYERQLDPLEAALRGMIAADERHRDQKSE